MTEEHEDLKRAIAAQLERAHGLPPQEAERHAAAMERGVRQRFAAWVRRELVIRRRQEHRLTRRGRPERLHPLDEGREFERFNLTVRMQHAIMAISVVGLIVTGLPLKFHERPFARTVIDLFGGPDVSPLVHRGFATALILVGFWHLAYIVLTRYGRENFKQLIPKPKDALDAWRQIRYFLGRADARPRFDRFSYVEKFDYWAVYWGMVVMIGSGAVLWFNNFFLRYFPKWATDIAKEAHSDEALLATLAIVVWHFYNVHLNPHKFPMNRTFLTGKISEREMIEEHPLEYERIVTMEDQAGKSATPPPEGAAGGSS
jgi:formate dehydrogenase subunit gamma